MSEKPESLIWEGSESQILNLGTFIVMLLIATAVIVISLITIPLLIVLSILPLGYAFWKWLVIKFNKYKITTERILYSTGIFSIKTETLELYRVKDLKLYEPLWLRIFGYGMIELQTSDETTPRFMLKAIPRPHELSDAIRKSVEARRDSKRVRGIEFLEDEVISDQ